MIRWLVFLDDAGHHGGNHWLQLDGARVAARGSGLPMAADAPVIAIVPGATVALHWVELPALAPAQAAAAARLLAADVSGAPMSSTHVALGDADAGGLRVLGLVDRTAMAAWLATLAAAGIVPECIVPLPLLLPVADTGPDEAVPVTLLMDDGICNVRGRRLAFATDPTLAELMLAGQTIRAIDREAFETGLVDALASMPIDLRQGEFAPARQWRFDARRLRRIGYTVAAAALLWLAGDTATLFRHVLAADRAESQLADAARAALPRGTAIDAPRAQVAARLARLGGDGQGFSTLAAPLLAAMRDRPAIILQSLQYAPDSGLAVVASAPAAADREALQAGMAGVNATVGAPRDDAGTAIVDVLVRPR